MAELLSGGDACWGPDSCWIWIAADMRTQSALLADRPVFEIDLLG